MDDLVTLCLYSYPEIHSDTIHRSNIVEIPYNSKKYKPQIGDCVCSDSKGYAIPIKTPMTFKKLKGFVKELKNDRTSNV
jgi:hypothetical protein